MTLSGGCRKEAAARGHTWSTLSSWVSPGCKHRLMVPAGRPRLSVKVKVTHVPPHAQYVLSGFEAVLTNLDSGRGDCIGSRVGGLEHAARQNDAPSPKVKQDVPAGQRFEKLHTLQ